MRVRNRRWPWTEPDEDKLTGSRIADLRAELAEERGMRRFWHDEFRRLHAEHASKDKRIYVLEQMLPYVRAVANEQASTGQLSNGRKELRRLLAESGR